VETSVESLWLSTDPALAHQVMVGLLSSAIQQAQPGNCYAAFVPTHDSITLTLRYQSKDGRESAAVTESTISKLGQRLHWTISYSPDETLQFRQAVLRMTPSRTTILVIEDNEGWVTLLQRYLEGFDCMVVAIEGDSDSVRRTEELSPSAIMLDIMMPQKDGWE